MPKQQKKGEPSFRKLSTGVIAAIIALVVALVVIAAAAIVLMNGKSEGDTGSGASSDAGGEADSAYVYVQMDVRDFGTIVLELDPSAAPITVANFKELVSSGFYDGLTFHRIISGFMIQGGDPKGNGTGGSSKTIKGEFAANGVQNPIKHTRGVISMARSSAPDSASSQFFIVHETSPHLDGSYAAFGHVVTGMDVVDAIAAVKTDSNDRPLESVVIERAVLLEGAP